MNWPNGGTVDPRALADLVIMISSIVDKIGARILVHCSAGRVRTGTFLATYFAHRDQKPLEETVRNLCGLETGRIALTPDESLAQNTLKVLEQNTGTHPKIPRDWVLLCLGEEVGGGKTTPQSASTAQDPDRNDPDPEEAQTTN